MANSAAICTQFKIDVLLAHHALGTTATRGGTSADTFKMMLMAPAGSAGAASTKYSDISANEVSSAGYTAKGTAFTWVAPAATGTTAYTTPSANITWTTVTFTTDCAVILNTTWLISASESTVAVYTFSSQTVTAGNFTLTMPTNDSSTGLLRVA